MQAPADSSPDAVTAGLVALTRHLLTGGNGEVLAAVEELGISLTQMKALGVLDTKGESSLKALGEALGLSLPAMSRSVDGLVKRGWVTREEHPDDRRSKIVRITPAGSEVIHEIATLRFSGLRTFVESLDDDQRQALAHALELLARRPEIAVHVQTETPC